MAIYYILGRENPSTQREEWHLSLEEAKKVVESNLLDLRPGSYWNRHFLKPLRSAKRQKKDGVVIETAGFSTSQFSNTLYSLGIESGWVTLK